MLLVQNKSGSNWLVFFSLFHQVFCVSQWELETTLNIWDNFSFKRYNNSCIVYICVVKFVVLFVLIFSLRFSCLYLEYSLTFKRHQM